MLITSRETRRWIIPKGWAERGVHPHEQAAREAYEEAGLVGRIGSKPIASYRYEKRLAKGRTRTCDVDVFLLSVERQVDSWPEMEQRQTEWFTPAEAAMLVEDGGLVTLLLSLAGEE